jgi:hypothetical protein
MAQKLSRPVGTLSAFILYRHSIESGRRIGLRPPDGTEGAYTMKKNTKVTMLEIFRAVQDACGSDDEVIAVIDHMMRTGRVVRRQQSLLLG